MNKIIFYIKKAIRDIKEPLIYDSFGEKSELVSSYYIKYDLSDMLGQRSQNFHFDDDGIPIIPHYIDSSSRKEDDFHYFPIGIGQMALAYLHEYNKTNEISYLDRFILLADWFCNNQTDDGYWMSVTNVDKFGIYEPWKSSMSQSRAMSVLLRAWKVTNDEKYKLAADKAFSTLIKIESPVCTNFHGRFYLEYPGSVSPKVLNGFIFSMYGLYDYYHFVGNDESKGMFDECVTTLKNIIDLFDTGYWSCYDYNHIEHGYDLNICTVHYHFIHVVQLETIFKLTGDEFFNNKSLDWAAYYDSKFNLFRIYLEKAKVVLSR